MKNRFYGFFGGNRASVAIHIQGEQVTVALAFCNRRDSFEKKTARNILNGRLDARLDSNRVKPVKHTFSVPYHGAYPKRDVMNPIMDVLRYMSNRRTHKAVVTALGVIAEDMVQVESLSQAVTETV